MPKPEPRLIAFEIDGREVSAPEGAMLVDGAKHGDVEIPVFCYEPKLGPPVGACRMCLVEIEGMPKLQTACSTAIRDGMVVVTKSERVKQAQSAIVEFLLVNHPLDCPVCDKGGECPLQDISFGWGAGHSRFIEPKRHFKKPLDLSPLVAIDRERCILCYRCVRFSQEVAEDYQLVFLERGDRTFVGTHDGHPYVGPFSGNIIELCPVGALTSTAYRFRARPWDVEGAGSICTLCPSQCNITFTVRDDAKVLRVLARDNDEVDDGWLCDKGRFAYQAIHSSERVTAPMVRDGGALREVSWERALAEAAAGLERSGARTATIVGGAATNEEGYLLQLLMREFLGSPDIDSRVAGGLDAEQARTLARPDLSAAVADIDAAETILVLDSELIDESPVLDLRVRKAVRRAGAKLVVATSRPGALDASASRIIRFAPGASEALVAALASAVAGGDVKALARRAGAAPEAIAEAASALAGAGSVVVLWGERLSSGRRGRQAVAALLALARAIGIPERPGAGLLEVPSATNARGLREVGCLPNLLPGLVDSEVAGRDAAEIAAALGGDLSGLLLFGADPLLHHPDRSAWEQALKRAGFIVGFADHLTEALADHANVVFPCESYAEKEGTLTHPDGRLQRLRQAIGHPGELRPAWSTLLALIERLSGATPRMLSAAMVWEEISDAVPFYRGITLEEIGGRGVRWQERDAASGLLPTPLPSVELERPPALRPGLRLGTRRSLWSGKEVEHSPVLAFLSPHQRAELSPVDAAAFGIAPGDEIEVSVNGASVRAAATLRDGLPRGSVFLIEGTAAENATALTGAAAKPVEVRKA